MLIIDESVPHLSKELVDFVCTKCGYHGKIQYNHYKEGIGCGVCNGKRVVAGLNDFCTTEPGLAKLLTDYGDGKSVSRRSHKILRFTCPTCKTVSLKRVADVTNRGFKCNACASSISFPNRVMLALLQQLNAKFVKEASFKWCGLKRYDFYLTDKNAIIEMHGKQHYEGFNGGVIAVSSPLEKIKANDHLKKQMAIDNGIDDYIEIDASESNIDYIAHSIMNSKIAEMFDLSGIDWCEIGQVAHGEIYSTIVRDYLICENAELVSKHTGYDAQKVRDILRIANKNGDCVYNPRESVLKCQSIASQSLKKTVICVTTGEIFDSIKEAASIHKIKEKTLSAHLVNAAKFVTDGYGNKVKFAYHIIL